MMRFSIDRQRVFTALAIISLPLIALGAEINPKVLKQTETKIRNLAKQTLPATIALTPAGSQARYGTGSGVIVSEDGLILTAAHVTIGMNEQVIVTFPDGRRVKGKVLGMDYSRDAGMVQITDPGKYPYVPLGDSRKLRENDWCVALGHAGGYQHDRPPPVRLGRVIENDSERFLRTDSVLIAGDSGGPLFDVEGRLIGIHSNIGYSLAQNNHVPISTYLENWERLKSGDRFGGDEEGALLANPDRPMIGAVLKDSPNKKGAIVSELFPNSPAARAGLVRGDTILEVNGSKVTNTRSLVNAIRKFKAGQTINLSVLKRGIEREVALKLASAAKLGIELDPPPPPAPKKRTPEETRKLQEELNRKLRRSMESGYLQLSDSDFEKFHSAAEFRQFIDRFKKTLTPRELAKLDKVGSPPEPAKVRPRNYDPDVEIPVGEPFFRDVLNAFRPSVAEASDATHLVFRGQEWKSLCTVIHENGYALTKASEIKTDNNQVLNVLLAKDKLVPATIVQEYPEHDLALLKLRNVSGLTTVKWQEGKIDLPLGSMISAPGSGPDPVAIGLISVKPRSLNGKTKGFLGVGTAHHSKGVRVTRVLQEGGAGKAGIRTGDIITRINSEICDSPDKLIRLISGSQPGTRIQVQIIRNGSPRSLNVTLGDREKQDARFPHGDRRMNKMGTEVSKKSTGFNQVIQNDLPIEPQHCGGPLVDLDGNVIGINIARAGRIKTYAIPADEIQRIVEPDLRRLVNREKAYAR